MLSPGGGEKVTAVGWKENMCYWPEHGLQGQKVLLESGMNSVSKKVPIFPKPVSLLRKQM